MNLKFRDMFNRKHRAASRYGISYNESSKNILGIFSRNNSPASFWLSGDIWWIETRLLSHCTTGPARIYLNGKSQFWLNDRQVTRMEVFLS